jgi:tetratricopeptide (TPR) repeat protein
LALFRFNFWHCSKKRVMLAKNMNNQIIRDKPNTKVADMAAQLNGLIEAIQQARYQDALVPLEIMMKDYLYQSVAIDVVDTFLIGPEWYDTSRPGTKERLAELERVFGGLAADQDPLKRDFGLSVLGRRYQLEGKNDDALMHYQKLLDAVGKPLQAFALKEVAHICRQSDPQRATAALEQFYSAWGKSVGGELGVLELADLYLAQGSQAKALATYQWVEDRRVRGKILLTSIVLQPRRGMMLSLQALGRNAAAATLANQLLQECGYGSPMSKLGTMQLLVIADALSVVGKSDGATTYQAELTRRATAR